jgi:hypothetical protein
LDVAIAAEVGPLAWESVDLGGLVIAQIRSLDAAVLLQKACEDRQNAGKFILQGFCAYDGRNSVWHEFLKCMRAEFALLVYVSILYGRA